VIRPLARALGVMLACGSASAQTPEAKAQAFLRQVIQLDEAQIASIDKGEVVTRSLPTTDKSEIAAFGAVRTGGDLDQLARLARDVRRFRKAPQVLELGVFGSPAALADLEGLTHPPDDIAALRKCKPGSCDVKLGTKGLEQISKLSWSAPDAENSLELLAAVPTADGKGLYLMSLYRTRIDPPTGMLAGVLMDKVRDGMETGVRESLKTARERLAGPR
jgi:hypothetical protein